MGCGGGKFLLHKVRARATVQDYRQSHRNRNLSLENIFRVRPQHQGEAVMGVWVMPSRLKIIQTNPLSDQSTVHLFYVAFLSQNNFGHFSANHSI